MDHANPLVVGLLFIVRCVVPLLIMLGISYLLKRLGLIQEPPQQAPDDAYDEEFEGEQLHGKV